VSRVEWIDETGRFDELRPEWEALAELQRLPFLRHGWFSAWWRAFGSGRRLQICALWNGSELVGALPLAAGGGGLEALANAHSPLFRPLARDEEALRGLAEAAVDRAPGILRIPELSAGEPAVQALAAASRRAGRLTLVENGRLAPLVETTGELAGYLQAMDRKARKDLDRRRRKLQFEQQASFAPIAVPADLERELTAGFEVEASGWKGERQTAVARSEDTSGFYRGLAEAFAPEGRLRLSTISVEGRAIAFDYCLLDHGRLWILKGGYDEGFRGYAPGLLLTRAQIERAFELGLEAVELCGDVAPWKLRFATASRPHCSVSSYRRRPAPIARFAYRRAVRPYARHMYRRLLPGRQRG
jgi:CelD/BcsL family acetyltransferase involved in cellulose biosynthesis